MSETAKDLEVSGFGRAGDLFAERFVEAVIAELGFDGPWLGAIQKIIRIKRPEKNDTTQCVCAP